MDIDLVIALRDVVKWHNVFQAAGLNPSTMRSAMRNRRPLRPEEAEALTRVLAQRGLLITEAGQTDLFATTSLISTP